MRVVILFTILCGLLSCSTVPAPVDHRQQPPPRKITTHEVGKGETLFSIAWGYGLDYRALARANNLDGNYTIRPGQILTLTESDGPSARKSSTSNATKASASSASSKPAPVPLPVVKSMGEGEVSWQWPTPGKVIEKFSEATSANKGIDIAGTEGEAVRAASGGRVVYAGSGLLGYGLLLIVKHNDRYLSAYAHNRELLVKEGDNVKAGERIALMGSSGTDRVKLHFEIRRDGKPVDPEDYLPRR